MAANSSDVMAFEALNSVADRLEKLFEKAIVAQAQENERQREFFLDLVKAGSEATLNGVKQVEGYTLK